MVDQKEYNKILKETDIAVRKGWDSTKIEWRKAALEIIYELCVAKEKFTANDFTEQIKAMPLKTHDNRAIGGLIRIARKFGWVEKSGESTVSKAGHLLRIQVWRSLICGKYPRREAEMPELRPVEAQRRPITEFSIPQMDWHKTKRAFVELGEGKYVMNGALGRQYRVYIGADGRKECECEAFKYASRATARTCKHIRSIEGFNKKRATAEAAKLQTNLF